MDPVETPFSPHSFDFYPGSPQQTNPEMKSFRFAGAPDGPLPSIPSDDESGSESGFVLRRENPNLTAHSGLF